MHTFYAFAAAGGAATDRGPVRIAATATGVCAVELLTEPGAFADGLARRGIVIDEAAAGQAARELTDRALDIVVHLLAGEDVDASAISLDLGDRPAWDRLVLDAVRAVPRGSTAGYGEIARRIGRAGAARAVGGAVGRNPVGLLVPCHRIVAGDGTLGGYGVAAYGGQEAALETKRVLLALEGVLVVGGRVSPGWPAGSDPSRPGDRGPRAQLGRRGQPRGTGRMG
jgi:methylated-DNA-[protein]-cysteine S-methyltransferase